MGFTKKTKYENIFEWYKLASGTCFYCNEVKPINIPLINDKGICDDCAKAFTIGHIGTDRHAIAQLATGLKSHKQAKKWLEDHGADLQFKYSDNGIYFYDCINNKAAYLKMHEALANNGFAAADREVMESYNSVEISSDGGIHIIY